MNDLLVIMAKEPLPGKVKTRLQPCLSPAESAALYRCFLQDRLDEVQCLSGLDKAIAYTPDSAQSHFTSLAPEGFAIFPQRGRDLSARLSDIVSSRLRDARRALAIMDSDSPDLPGSVIRDCFRLLHGGADVVFGPCRDGGYYLVGMQDPHPEIFHDIPWSTPEVLSVSLERVRSLGLEPGLLPSWQDIDTLEDLAAFYERWEARSGNERLRGRRTAAHIELLRREGKI